MLLLMVSCCIDTRKNSGSQGVPVNVTDSDLNAVQLAISDIFHSYGTDESVIFIEEKSPSLEAGVRALQNLGREVRVDSKLLIERDGVFYDRKTNRNAATLYCYIVKSTHNSAEVILSVLVSGTAGEERKYYLYRKADGIWKIRNKIRTSIS